MASPEGAQEAERRFRDAIAEPYIGADPDALLRVVRRHHAVPLMVRRAQRFRARVGGGRWIVDVGVGWGWHWRADAGRDVLGVDMSLENLRVARRLVTDAVLVCADAAALPLRSGSVAGFWSVQTFQHFPGDVRRRAFAELERVTTESSTGEVYELNFAALYRAVYRLAGRRLSADARAGALEIHRTSGESLRAEWRRFRGGTMRVEIGYSEVFFHPEFGVRPRPYPLRLESWFASVPAAAALIARQVEARVVPA